MNPQEEKKQEEKQREIPDAELQKVTGGAARRKLAVARRLKEKVSDVELTGVTGGTGQVLKRAARKRR